MDTFMQEAARMALQQAGTSAVSNYIQSIAGNTALLANAAAVPQAIGTPFGYYTEDQRPIETQKPDGSRANGSWAAAAPFEVCSSLYHLGQADRYTGRSHLLYHLRVSFGALAQCSSNEDPMEQEDDILESVRLEIGSSLYNVPLHRALSPSVDRRTSKLIVLVACLFYPHQMLANTRHEWCGAR